MQDPPEAERHPNHLGVLNGIPQGMEPWPELPASEPNPGGAAAEEELAFAFSEGIGQPKGVQAFLSPRTPKEKPARGSPMLPGSCASLMALLRRKEEEGGMTEPAYGENCASRGSWCCISGRTMSAQRRAGDKDPAVAWDDGSSPPMVSTRREEVPNGS